MRRVHTTIVVVGGRGKYYIFRELFVVLSIQHEMRMRHSAMCGLTCSTTFFHII